MKLEVNIKMGYLLLIRAILLQFLSRNHFWAVLEGPDLATFCILSFTLGPSMKLMEQPQWPEVEIKVELGQAEDI